MGTEIVAGSRLLSSAKGSAVIMLEDRARIVISKSGVRNMTDIVPVRAKMVSLRDVRYEEALTQAAAVCSAESKGMEKADCSSSSESEYN